MACPTCPWVGGRAGRALSNSSFSQGPPTFTLILLHPCIFKITHNNHSELSLSDTLILVLAPSHCHGLNNAHNFNLKIPHCYTFSYTHAGNWRSWSALRRHCSISRRMKVTVARTTRSWTVGWTPSRQPPGRRRRSCP